MQVQETSISTEAILDLKLSPMAVRLLCLLCASADGAREVSATQKELADALGASRATVQRGLVALRAGGYLQWTVGGQSASVYRLLWRGGGGDQRDVPSQLEAVRERLSEVAVGLERLITESGAVREQTRATEERVGALTVLINTLRVESHIRLVEGNADVSAAIGTVVDPDATATTRAMVNAAVALIAEQGYHRTTTKSIASAAGVDESTLFRAFGSKDRLLATIVRDATRAMDEALSIAPTGELRADLELLCERYWRYWYERPWAFLMFLEATHVPLAGAVFVEDQTITGSRLARLYDAHRAHLAFPPEASVMEVEHDVSIGLLGPILSLFVWTSVDIDNGRFDAKQHVERFLWGYGVRGDGGPRLRTGRVV